MNDLRRQRSIWKALQAEFGDSARRKIGMILAYTPDEWDFDDSERTAGRGDPTPGSCWEASGQQYVTLLVENTDSNRGPGEEIKRQTRLPGNSYAF